MRAGEKVSESYVNRNLDLSTSLKQDRILDPENSYEHGRSSWWCMPKQYFFGTILSAHRRDSWDDLPSS